MTKNRQRVIFDGEVLVAPHFSGIGHYCLELLRAIDKQLKGDQLLDFYILVNFNNAQKIKDFNFTNIKIIASPFSKKFSNILKRLNIQPFLDLFVGRGIYIFPDFSSWPLINSKNISFIYDVSFIKYPEFTDPKNQTFLAKQVRKSVDRASFIATISESSKSDIEQSYNTGSKEIDIFYPAVDKNIYFRRPLIEIDNIKNKYGLPKNYILFVGNIEPRKNLENLLHAYEKMPRQLRSTYPLLLVGAKGWQDDKINKIIKRLIDNDEQIIQPSSYIPDNEMPAIYSGASLFIYPSIYEGFGIPPLEAMACGTPVVSADNSSLPEAVGDAAAMVDALSVNSISLAIDKLLNDEGLRKYYIEKGYKQIEQFSWDVSAKNFLIKLKTLI